MHITAVNSKNISVIPPNVPSSREDTPSFGYKKDNEDTLELKKQKRDLDSLANDKKNPLSGPIKFLAILTGAVITGAAMKVTLNTSCETISNVLKKPGVKKYTSDIENALSKSKKLLAEKIEHKAEDSKFISNVKSLLKNIDNKFQNGDAKKATINIVSATAACGAAVKELDFIGDSKPSELSYEEDEE